MPKKKGSKNNLKKLCDSCLLFKKYAQYDLWFGGSDEYKNIVYCKKYTQKYIYYQVHIFLLQRFNLPLVIFLYTSPCFTKFVESGFLKYLDSNFLLSFHNNRFTCDSTGKKKMKAFVKIYFQNVLRGCFEEDLLILVIKLINEIAFKPLTNGLKTIQISAEQTLSNDKDLFKEAEIQKIIYVLGGFYFNYLIKRGLYKPYFTNFDNLSKINIGLFFLKNFMYKSSYSSLKFINFKDNEISKFYLSKPVGELAMEEGFIDHRRKIKPSLNNTIHSLVESIESLDEFEEKSIGFFFYKNYNTLSSEDCLIPKWSVSERPFENYLKSFKRVFDKNRYKRRSPF